MKSVFNELGKMVGGVKRNLQSLTMENNPKIVIAINGVDLIEGGWNYDFNLPSPEQNQNIKKKCEVLSKRLSRMTGVPLNQIAYYSALQYYRLENLLAAMVLATSDGFIWGNFKPKSFVDKSKPWAKEKMIEMRDKEFPGLKYSIMEKIMMLIKEKIPADKYDEVVRLAKSKMEVPPKVALLGQSGVGKTTTICSLLGVDPLQAEQQGLKISHTGQGSFDKATYDLKTPQGTISLVDLPGYGVSSSEDAKYYEIYKKVIPESDVLLFVIQANNRAIAQDELMIKNVMRWMKVSA